MERGITWHCPIKGCEHTSRVDWVTEEGMSAREMRIRYEEPSETAIQASAREHWKAAHPDLGELDTVYLAGREGE